ncbi:MAG: ubiquitin-conjugating enzyme E2 [Promethearchaeota archaeon]
MDSQFDFILAREAQLIYRRAREFKPVNGNLTQWRGSILGRDSNKTIKFEVEILISPEFPRQAPQVKMITPTDHPQVDPNTSNLNLRILTYWRPEYHLYQVINSIKGLFARIPPKLPDTFTSTLIPSLYEASFPETPTSPPTFQSPTFSPPKTVTPTASSKTVTLIVSSKTKTPTTSSKEVKHAMPEESPKILDLKHQISHLESELTSLQKTLVNKEEEVARLEGRMDAHNIPIHGQVDEVLLPQDPNDKQILDLQSEKIAVEDLIRTLEDKFEFGEISSGEYAKLYKSYQKELFLIKQKLKEMGITQ